MGGSTQRTDYWKWGAVREELAHSSTPRETITSASIYQLRCYASSSGKNALWGQISYSADGCLLPFGDRIFTAVLMMHVLAAGNWRGLLAEAQRVLQSGGVLAIGKTEPPPEGIDATMRNRLAELIAGMGIAEPLPDRSAVREWLRARSSRHIEIRPVRWTLDRTPREFFLRKRTAARFGSLPAEVRETALRSLADWTERSIGPLDRPFSETHHFCLELHWF